MEKLKQSGKMQIFNLTSLYSCVIIGLGGIMLNEKIKEVIKEMILSGEIKIEVETRYEGLHYRSSYFSISVDNEKQPIKFEERVQYTS